MVGRSVTPIPSDAPNTSICNTEEKWRNVDLLASVIFKELILISGLPASVHVLIHLLPLSSESRDNLKPTITPRPPGISSKIVSIELNTLCEHNKLKKSYTFKQRNMNDFTVELIT